MAYQGREEYIPSTDHNDQSIMLDIQTVSSATLADVDDSSDFIDQGKIGIDELPLRGSAKRGKELFERRIMTETEKFTPDLMMVSEGVTKTSLRKFESGMVSTTTVERSQMDNLPEAGVASQAKAAYQQRDDTFTRYEDEDLGTIQGGLAASTRAAFEADEVHNAESRRDDEEEECRPITGTAVHTKAMFEKGQAGNVTRTKEEDEEDALPEKGSASKQRHLFEQGLVSNVTSSQGDDVDGRPEEGSASKTKAMFEAGNPYQPEDADNVEKDDLQELVNTAAANAVRKRYESGEYSREDQREKRLSYTPTAGSSSAARTMFEHGVATKFNKDLEEEENLPDAGLARDTRARFERGEVTNTENSQISWKEDLQTVYGAAASSRAAYQAATEKSEVTKQTDMEQEMEMISQSLQDPHRFDDVDEQDDTHGKLVDEELRATMGKASEARRQFETGEVETHKYRTLDMEELPTTPGSAKDKKTLYESGQVNRQARKTIDEEDFSLSAGKAKTAHSYYEQGKFQKELKKMIDEEELPVTSGIASESKRLIDSGHYIHSPHRTIEDEELPSSSGSAREKKMLIEQGAHIHAAKKTYDESELELARGGAADQTRKRFEKGITDHETKRTVDEEELAYARGAADERKRLFEQGFQGQETKRTVDEEELAYAKGASNTRRMFEEGHLESKPKKYIDEEKFHGSRTARKMAADRNGEEVQYEDSESQSTFSARYETQPEESADKIALKEELSNTHGAASERRKFFEQGAFVQSPKKTIDEEELPVGSGALQKKTRLIEQGYYQTAPKKYIDEEEFPETMRPHYVSVPRDEEPGRYVSTDAKPGAIPTRHTDESVERSGTASMAITLSSSTKVNTETQ